MEKCVTSGGGESKGVGVSSGVGCCLHKVTAREDPRLKGAEEVHPLCWDGAEGCLCAQNWQFTVPGVRVCMAHLRSHGEGATVHCSVFMSIAGDRLLYFKKGSNFIVLEARGSNRMVSSFSGISLVTLYCNRYVYVRMRTYMHVHMHIQSCFASVTMYKQVDHITNIQACITCVCVYM